MKTKGNRIFGASPQKVETLTLSEDHKRRKLVLTIVFFVVGFFFLGRGIYAGLNRQGGWIEIQAQYGTDGCGGEFQFQYCLDNQNGNAEYRELTLLYTELCAREAKVYSSTEREAALGNLAALNAAPNEELSLEPELYRALEKLQASGDRTLYLAPLYAYYTSLFFCEQEEETLEYDPLRNPELARTFGELAAFAGDPAQIDVELLGENRARLKVSADYLDYAARNEIGVLADFGWMKNAFILDDLTEAIRARGFHRGYLQSYDGFGCNFCDTGESFSLNVFDRPYGGDGVAAQMSYTRPVTFLSLHSYTATPRGNDFYYEMTDGSVRSIFVDAADGMPKTALDDLLVWSDTRSCGELVLAANRVYTADRLDRELLEGQAWFYAFCLDRTLFCNDPAVRFPKLAEGYRLEQAG